jgi:hypothetical protein
MNTSMSAAPALVICILAAVIFNVVIKWFLKNWNTKSWIKNLTVFVICFLLAIPLGEICRLLINQSLEGSSGGIGMIGVGIGAALGLVLSVILYLVICFTFLVVRLVRKK